LGATAKRIVAPIELSQAGCDLGQQTDAAAAGLNREYGQALF
jgi:hypothetical protein